MRLECLTFYDWSMRENTLSVCIRYSTAIFGTTSYDRQQSLLYHISRHKGWIQSHCVRTRCCYRLPSRPSLSYKSSHANVTPSTLHSSQTVISISVHKKDIQVIHFVVIKSSYSINTSESCSSDDEP